MKVFEKIEWPENFSFGERGMLEGLIGYLQDFAEAYDLGDECTECIEEFFKDNDIDYVLGEDDDDELDA